MCNFSQSEYCLLAAYAMLPPDLNKKKKLRALVEMHLGQIYLEKLTFTVANYLNNEESIPEIVNHKSFEYPELLTHVKWPEMKDITCAEEAFNMKSKALKYLRRALKHFRIQATMGTPNTQ